MENNSKWERIETGLGEADRLYSKPRSFAEDVWFRFRHKPTSLIGLIIILFLLLFAIAGPYLTPYGYDDQNTKLANIPPLMKVYPAPDGHYLYITAALKIIEVDEDGRLLSQLRKGKDNAAAKVTVYPYNDTTVTLDYTEMPAAIQDQDGNRITNAKKIVFPCVALWTPSASFTARAPFLLSSRCYYSISSPRKPIKETRSASHIPEKLRNEK